MKRRDFLKGIGAAAASSALGWQMWQVAAQPAQGQQFLLPPTIHHMTDETAILYLMLSQPPVNGKVIIEADGALVQEVALTNQPVQHLTITDLTPATRYQYRVEIAGSVPPVYGIDQVWDDLSFRTTPYDEPFRVVAVGDSGFGGEATAQLAELMAAQNPDFFLHLGDVVYRMEEYENDHFLNWNLKYFAPFSPLLRQMPHYPTFGNHDKDIPTRIDDIPSYYTIFPPFDGSDTPRDWYHFDVGDVQFICLNSQVFYSHGDLRTPQDEWLAMQLERDDVDYTVIFFHVAPFTSAGVHQWDGLVIAESWLPQFEQSPANVALVVGGHSHNYERLAQNGIHYVVAGGGSAVLYGLGDSPMIQSEIFRARTSFPVLEFHPDHIHLEAYALDGTQIEAVDLPVRERET